MEILNISLLFKSNPLNHWGNLISNNNNSLFISPNNSIYNIEIWGRDKE